MNETTTLQLQTSAILEAPFCSYDKDFTFIVNGEKFQTTKIISDLLSSKICKMHQIDPTFDLFTIKTTNSGHFSCFLKLINFSQETISDEELPFIAEILNSLQSKHITLKLPPRKEKITINNIIEIIKSHEKNQNFYREYLKEEIDFISTHFYELSHEQEQQLKDLKIDTVELIFNQKELKLRDENQLLNLLNELYQTDHKYAKLYKYIFFSHVDEETIFKFIEKFDINDLDNEIWKQISSCLVQKVSLANDHISLEKRYIKNQMKNALEFICNHDNKFNGIINHLRKESKGNVQNVINITSSSVYSNKTPYNVCLFENDDDYFETSSEPNSWICFDFKDKKIIPKNYLIKTGQGKGCNNPKTWILEGSNDQSSWETLDKQDNCSYMNEKYAVHTFDIQKKITDPFRYIRIMQTGPNWQPGNYYYFVLGSVEFYGSLTST